jgi:sugar lactone lactonase YvrE
MVSSPRSRHAATVLVIFLLWLGSSRVAHASFGLAFQGYAQLVNTGAITLSSASDIVVDSAGNIYIADTGHSQIVEVNAAGTASVLTISGLSLNAPAGIAIDGAGNLYIADTGNSRVVEVSPSGTASVIGLGSVMLSSPQGIALDPSGDIFIADTGHNQIVEVPAGGSAAVVTITGLGTALNTPIGLAVDRSGKLYIADSANNRIVGVPAGSTTGSVIAIADGVVLATPSGIAVDSIGNLFIADTGHNRIAEVDTAGNGSVLQTGSFELGGPLGVAVDVFGGVYIADTGNSRGLIVDPPMSPLITSSYPTYSLNKTAVGFGHIQLGSSQPVTLTLPFTIGVSPVLGSVSIFTSGVQGLDFTLVSGSTTCVAETSVSACTVTVSFLPTAPGLRTGAVVLYDTSTPANPILTLPLYGFGDSPIAALAPNTGTVISTGNVALSNPYQLALDGSGNMYVGDYTGRNVTRIPAGGGSASVVNLGTPGSVAVQNITGVAVDGAGNLFIGDHQNSRILVVTPGGVVSVLSISGLGTPLGFPVALAFDASGTLYIADFTVGRIVKVSSLNVSGSTATGNGTVLTTSGYSFAGSTLTGVTVDWQGSVYIAARTDNNSGIVKVTSAGVSSLLAPNGVTLSDPQGVGVDAMGNIYIVDTGNSRIVKMTTTGLTSVLKISGLSSPSTLGGLLFGVTLDPSGNFYIPDWSNNRIVFVNVSGAAMTYSATNQGQTSSDSPKTATVTNLGNQPLVFSTNPTFTANFSENTGDTNPCTSSTSLLAGTACDVSIDFTPQSVGSLSAGITVTDNTLNVAGSTQQVAVSGIGVNPGDSTATTVAISPTSLSNGQAATITATVSDTATGHTSTIPTGAVTFTDTVGATVTTLNGGSPVNLAGGTATLSGVALHGIGTHTIAANYAGVSGSFISSSGSTTAALSKASVTVTGPGQPVVVTVGQTGSVTITIAGPYSTIAAPSGTVSYSILNASSTGVASGTIPLTPGSTSSTASIPVPNSLAGGSYTISVTYSGDSNYLGTSAATTITLNIGQIAPAITWNPAASSITYGATLAGILNASAQNGSTTVPGTFTYTATLSGGSAAAVNAASVLGAGVYTLTATFTPSDTTTYQSVSKAIAFTVNKAAAAITLASSANPALAGNPVTFTATVSSSAGTPTGTVSFFDNTATLGPAVLSGGIATATTSSLGQGTYSIIAVYSGDANFTGATSGPVSESILDFSLSSSGPGSGGSGGKSQTAAPGGAAEYTLAIVPTSGTEFPAPITLTVTGLPSGASALIGPSTWTQLTGTSWSFPANTAVPSVTMTVQLPRTSASLDRTPPFSRPRPPLFLGVLLLPFAVRLRRTAQRLHRLASLLLLISAAMAAVVGLSGCGSSGYFGQQEKTYNIVVTATSGTLSHSTTVTLTVE